MDVAGLGLVDEPLENLDAGKFDHDHLPARAIPVHFPQWPAAGTDYLAAKPLDDPARADAVIPLVVLLAGNRIENIQCG